MISQPTTRRRFRPRLGPTLVTVAAMAVLISLGTWQLQRLAWKEGLIATRAAGLALPPVALPAESDDWPGFEFRRVSLEGRFDHDGEQLYGASTHQGQLGHHVLTPLVREDGRAVLVDRGWVPATQAHPATRRAGQVEGAVEVTGIARYRADQRPGWFTPANEPAARLWYSFDLEALATAVGHRLLPVVVEADASTNPGGLPLGGQTRIALVNNHLGYAVTWFGLAAGLLVVYLLFTMRSGESE